MGSKTLSDYEKLKAIHSSLKIITIRRIGYQLVEIGA